MKTEDLITSLTADARPRWSLELAWAGGAVVAVVAAAAALMASLGFRPDIASAAATVRFDFKLALMAALAIAAFAGARSLARPGGTGQKALPFLIAVPAVLLAAVALELLVLPREAWQMAQAGKNSLLCMTSIPLIGLIPLAVFLAVNRYGAPTRAVWSGAAAGLAAGGVGAFFYATHCPDDSPLFVATWYPVGIALLTALGALGGRFLNRW